MAIVPFTFIAAVAGWAKKFFFSTAYSFVSLGVTVVLFSCGLAQAQDQLQMKNTGAVLTGTVLKVDSGQVMIQTGSATVPVDLANVQSAVVPEPDSVRQILSNTDPASLVTGLEPVVAQYGGLPVDWIVQAMVALEDAYSKQGKQAQADALTTQLSQDYASGPIHDMLVLAQAKLMVASGHFSDAATALAPLIKEANAFPTPAPGTGPLFAQAFLLQGQIDEAQKNYDSALSCYLTVTTVFYQDSDLVTDAQEKSKALLQSQPTASVD